MYLGLWASWWPELRKKPCYHISELKASQLPKWSPVSPHLETWSFFSWKLKEWAPQNTPMTNEWNYCSPFCYNAHFENVNLFQWDWYISNNLSFIQILNLLLSVLFVRTPSKCGNHTNSAEPSRNTQKAQVLSSWRLHQLSCVCCGLPQLHLLLRLPFCLRQTGSPFHKNLQAAALPTSPSTSKPQGFSR